MSEFHHFEYPPPRSWEQFEEICADLFEAMWNDSGLVRHGRAGQKQNGVDIVARKGGLYPIGLQCKKKSKWPVKKLTNAEIDNEIEEAKSFTPPLEAFYLLTTAEDDSKLQLHIRQINENHKMAGLFQVVLLAWPEIIRRITRYERVARKHFSGFGSEQLLSPLLATWYTASGKLELKDAAWKLSVAEVAEDFFDWPNGHIAIRQRETDVLIQKLQELIGLVNSRSLRKKKLQLRKELRQCLCKERYVETAIKLIFSNEKCRFYFLELWERDADLPVVVRVIIEHELNPRINQAHEMKIRVHPPSSQLLSGYRSQYSVADSDIAINMPQNAYMKIENIKRMRCERYGNPLTETVGELPAVVRAQYVVPAIIRRILRIQEEERKTLFDMEVAGYLDLSEWKVTY